MTNFYILGMPRSRTAWLSFLFTKGDVYCYHEGRSSHLEQERIDLDKERYKYVGSSDTNPLTFEETDSRVLLIYRDIKDIERSIKNNFKKPYWLKEEEVDKFIANYLNLYQQKMDSIQSKSMVISYQLLDYPEVIKEVWEYLLPGKEVDEEWIERCMCYNIKCLNRDLDKPVSKVAASYGYTKEEFKKRILESN